MRIYEYTPGFLHAKCCVSDDRAAVVGSINMDYRSMFLHFECGVLLLQNSQVLTLRDDVRRTPAPVPGGAVRGLPHRSGGYGAGQRAAAVKPADVNICS